MSSIYICPECDNEFEEHEATIVVQNANFSLYDDTIQAISLVHCPDCENIVVAVFDSMECSKQFDL